MKQFWLFCGIVLSTIVIDQITKRYALGAGLAVPNPGFILGWASSSPILIRTFCIGAFYGTLLYTFLSFCLFVPMKSPRLYLALSFLLGGFGGNTVDRVTSFSTIDFIPNPFYAEQVSYLNIADIFIVVGLIWFWVELWLLIKPHFSKDNLRAGLKGAQKSQMVFARKMVIGVTLLMIALSICFVALVEVVFRASGIPINDGSRLLMYGTILCSAFLILTSFAMMIRYYSQSIFGPIHALKRQLIEQIKGGTHSSDNLHLRNSDQWPELNLVYRDIVKAIKENQT